MAFNMESLQLSETEQRYFGDLFLCCDIDNTGKIPKFKASELFRTANIPLDALKQIFELSGAGTHLGRKQFYAALKLVAATQAGMTLQPEMMHRVLEVPLPRFTWTTPTPQTTPPADSQRNLHINSNSSPDLIQLSDTDPTPLPVVERASSGGAVATSDSETEPPTRIRSKRLSGSPEASSTASDSPTPTNSVKERAAGHGPWVNSTHHHWQGLEEEPGLSEEQRQLLGTEEESSDRHSSEEEDDSDDGEDVWAITPEQRDYYTAQFRALQPDPSGLLAGSVARLFFEKSKLPVHELRRIWQLSDVTKDGALSLEEFNTAMHLVVLRRNSIPLPAELPTCLQPPLLNLSSPLPPPPPPPVVPKEPVPPPRVPPPTAPNIEPQPQHSPPSSSPADTSSPPRSKEWTKFGDSPTSSVSSPGPKPVNFDFHKSAVEQDPKILHPVPLRVTPDSQVIPQPSVANVNDDENGGGVRSPRRLTANDDTEQTSPKRSGPIAQTQTSIDASDIRPIQRPQPKKPTAVGRGAIPPPPQPQQWSSLDYYLDTTPSGTVASVPTPQGGPRKDPPPPPPPRPRTHTRSSSLDLNTLGKGNNLNAPPQVPPRVSPAMTSPNKKLTVQHSEGDSKGFADFAQFTEPDDGQAPRRHGAFEIYRKPQKIISSKDEGDDVTDHKNDALPRYIPDLDAVGIKTVKEHTTALTKLCQRLSRELFSLQEEHAGLRAQLDSIPEN